MLSDRFKLLKIISILILLVLLIVYAQIKGPKILPGLKEFRQNPTIFLNKELEISGRIKKIETNRFWVEVVLDKEKTDLEIKGTLSNAKIADTIYVVVVYQVDQSLTLNRYLISNSRPIKVVISLAAALWVAILFWKEKKCLIY